MANITKEAGSIKFKGLVDITQPNGSKETDVDITNQGDWSSNSDWAHIDNTGLVNYEENTGEERKAIITLKYKDLTDTEELIQAGTGGGEPEPEPIIIGYENATIIISEDSPIKSDNIIADGGSLILKCLATAKYNNETTKENIDITNLGNWSSDSAFVTNENNTFDINSNEDSQQRKFNVTFSYNEYSINVQKPFVQLGNGEEPEPIEPHYKDLVLTGQTVDYPIDQVPIDGGITGVKGTATYVNEAGEEEKGVDVTSKLIFVSSSDNNCIKGDEEYYLVWNANENSNSRSSTITYKLDGQEDLTATIITTQLGTGGGTGEDILEVEPEEVIFGSNGGNQEITITSNVDWTIE